MNPAAPVNSPRIQLNEKNADRLGVAASVLCAIHCALAPLLLIFLPTFGRVWAHPASHALVAIFIVPLAAFSILKGFRKHGKRWIPVSATIGIFLVLFGAILPAFSKTEIPAPITVNEPTPVTQATVVVGCDESCEDSCDAACEADCEGCPGGTAADAAADDPGTAACVDGCCPSIQVSDTGETSLHIPPAAIITTLGGVFLIAAHIGNLRSGAGTCLMAGCPSC